MNDFRELVDVEMESTDTTSTPVVSPLPIAAHRLMLRKGDRGESVKEMQRGIGGLTADGLFGPATDRRVRRGRGSTLPGSRLREEGGMIVALGDEIGRAHV